MRFTVHAHGTTPGLGEPAPKSDSLTATTPDEVKDVSTDPDPYPPAYTHTIGEVVSSGKPSMVFFATPAFCQTGVCGPTLEVVKSVAKDYADVKDARGRPIGKRAEGWLFEKDHLQVGNSAPEVESTDLSGVAFKLSDYRGKVVLLDFWGNW